VVAADFTGGPSHVKGAFGVGFADDGLAAVTLDPRASAALQGPLAGLAPCQRIPRRHHRTLFEGPQHRGLDDGVELAGLATG
jgi:hypothetical protein